VARQPSSNALWERQLQASAVRDIEQIRLQRVTPHAKTQTTMRRPNEYAARRSQLDDAGTRASTDARFERSCSSESIADEGETNPNGCGPCREGTNHAT